MSRKGEKTKPAHVSLINSSPILILRCKVFLSSLHLLQVIITYSAFSTILRYVQSCKPTLSIKMLPFCATWASTEQNSTSNQIHILQYHQHCCRFDTIVSFICHPKAFPLSLLYSQHSFYFHTLLVYFMLIIYNVSYSSLGYFCFNSKVLLAVVLNQYFPQVSNWIPLKLCWRVPWNSLKQTPNQPPLQLRA